MKLYNIFAEDKYGQTETLNAEPCSKQTAERIIKEFLEDEPDFPINHILVHEIQEVESEIDVVRTVTVRIKD